MPEAIATHPPARTRIRAAAILVALTLLATTGWSTAGPAHAATPAPSGLMSDESRVPVLSWDRIPGATSYRVQGYSSGDWSGTPLWNESTTNTNYVPRTVVSGTVWWRVQAFDGSTWSPWADSHFDSSSLSIPANLSVPSRVRPPVDPAVFAWSPVEGASGYTVEVDAEGDGTGGITQRVAVPGLVWKNSQDPGDYFVRVRAEFNGGSLLSPWSTYTRYDVSALPSVTASSCAEGLVCAPHPVDGVRDPVSVEDVVLDWDAVPGAASYEVRVATDENFSNQILTRKVTGTRYSPPVNLDNRNYFWQVRALTLDGSGSPWPTTSSAFRREWPTVPLLVGPTDSATPAVSGDLSFQWTPVAHASRYQLDLGLDPNFTPNSYWTCKVAGTSFTVGHVRDACQGLSSPARPTQGRTYYWRVRALDEPSGQTGIYSRTREFIWDHGAVPLVAPVSGSTVSVPTLQWRAVPEVHQYRVSLTDGAGNQVDSITTAALSWTTSKSLVPGTQYRWTVTPVLGDNKLGVTYPGRSFTYVTPTASATPLTAHPTLTGTTSARFPGLSWDPVEGAAYYRLRLEQNGYRFNPTVPGDVLDIKLAHPAVTDWKSTFLKPGTYTFHAEAFAADNSPIPVSTPIADRRGTFAITELGEVTGQQIALDSAAIDAGDTCTARLGDLTDPVCGPVPVTPVLDWDAVPGAGGYMVYLFDDSDLTTPIYDPKVVATESSRWTPPASVRDFLADSNAGGAYYWFVRPCVEVHRTFVNCGPDPESLIDSATNAFRKISPSVEPTSPAEGAEVADEITFRWEDYLQTNQRHFFSGGDHASSQAATTYRIQVSQSDQMTSPIEEVQVDQTTYTSPTTTYPEGELWWRVQAVDGSGNRLAWSTPRMVEKLTPSPNLNPDASSPDEQSTVDASAYPRHNARIASSTFAFRWKARAFDSSWTIEVYKNDDQNLSPANRVISATSSQSAYVPPQGLPASDQAYRWRVRRVDVGNKPGRWSDLGRFFVDPAAPELVSPTPGESVRPDDVVLRWTAPSTAARSYSVQLRSSTSPSSTTIVTPATAFAPTSTLAGGTWTWTVTALDSGGNEIGRTTGSFAVDNVLTASTPVRINAPDGARVGYPLTLTSPTWNQSNVATTYQWTRNGSTIFGATGPSYTPTAGDLGKSLSVTATGKRPGYVTGTSLSNALVVGEGDAISNLERPDIQGEPRVGQRLTATPGSWSDPQAKLSYQWLRDGAPITYATGSAYTVGTGDAGSSVTVKVTATRAGYGPASATSRALAVGKLTTRMSVGLSTSKVPRRTRATLTTVVTVEGGGVATGTLTVKDGRRVLKRLTLTREAYGRSSWRLPRLSVGRHTLKVSYSGSSAMTGSGGKARLRVTRR